MKVTVLCASLATVCLALCSAQAAVLPIPVTGWNHDMIQNNPGPYNLNVTGTMDGGFDQVENWVWPEAGTYPGPDGPNGNDQTADEEDLRTIPGFTSGVLIDSLTGNGKFIIQPVDGMNVIGLDGDNASYTTGTLTLDTPAYYSTIALYGASGNGGKDLTITLNFADSTTTEYNISGSGIGTDWFNGNADRAMEVGARVANRSEDAYTDLFVQTNSAISINETLLALSETDQGKLLESVTIFSPESNFGRTAIFAISGEVVPEPSTVALLGVSGLALVVLRRRS